MPYLRVEHPPFHLALTLTMGQALRWRMEGNGWISGIIRDKLVKLRQVGDRVEFVTSRPDKSDKDVLRRYLRLDEDIRLVHDTLRDAADMRMVALLRLYGGVRVLRQDPWECLITYALSPSQSVDRIGTAVKRLANEYGETILLDTNVYKRFPTAECLVQTGLSELIELSLGPTKHVKLIHKLAIDVVDGELNLDCLGCQGYGEAISRLMGYRGIGPKVSNCVLLFSMGQAKAFPIDRWILRALPKDEFPDEIHGAISRAARPTGRWLSRQEYRVISEGAQNLWGDASGYASQLLFHGIRDGAIRYTPESTLT